MLQSGFFPRLKPILACVCLLGCLLSWSGPAFSGSDELYPGFPPIRQSEAYAAFKKRPVDDHSRLVYLIDRFQEAKIEILYDGYYFKPGLAANVARWFLKRYYKEETPKQWIMRWCNQSIIKNELIWVKLPGGKFKLAREVLLNEIKRLNRALEEDGLATSAK